MPDLRPIFHIVGLLLTGLAVLMLVPAAADLMTDNPDWFVFWVASVVTGFCGVALILSNRRPNMALNIKQAFVLTTVTWVALALFAALPFRFANDSLSFTGSVFEAASGLTTTGATVLTGLDAMPPGILLWRGLLQLVGGLGIIVMAIAILPFLGVGGMQLLRTESSDRMDKVMPRARQITIATARLYGLLAVVCGFGYWFGGMAPFDAAIHAMTTISSGGFSTSDSSIAHWPSTIVVWNAIVFMVLAGLPFTLYLKALKGSWRELVFDDQVCLFAGIVAVASGVIAIWLYATGRYDAGAAITQALFNVISIITTTGFATTDYNLWGSMPLVVFALLLSVGGCTGSTAGGIKMLRFVVLWEMARCYVRQLVTPRGVFQQRFNGVPIAPDVVTSVMAFIGIYFATLVVVALVLSALGLDTLTSFSAAAACLGNVGPGLGEIVGPAGHYRSLHPAAIWVLSAAMIMGRLELFTVLVMCTRHFWRS
ncbi:MAG: TrkH family potassium uptake protein [Rhodobacteraceae bacterium]|nr:TrkH family potassium uptake protein [Paracoccaceae bacterium]